MPVSGSGSRSSSALERVSRRRGDLQVRTVVRLVQVVCMCARPLGKHGATVRSTRSAPPSATARRPAHAADHAWRLRVARPTQSSNDPVAAAPLSEPRRPCSRVPHLPQAAQLVKLGRAPARANQAGVRPL